MKKFFKLWAVILIMALLASAIACAPSSSGGSSSGGSSSNSGSSSSSDGQQPEEPDYEIPAYLETKAEKAGRVSIVKKTDCPSDFLVNVEGEEDVRILQITDTQMIDPEQLRKGYGKLPDRYGNRDECVYDIVRQTVENTKPDLIVITGDFVYGDYDDNGKLFREQTDFFDSLQIYWIPIFGNHDNASDSNYSTVVDPEYPEWYARKQCKYFENAEYCLFKTRSTVSGYCNYSVTVSHNGEFERQIICLDTHGNMGTELKLNEPQVKYAEETVRAVNEWAKKSLPVTVCYHVPMQAFIEALSEKYGYDKTDAHPDFVIPENDQGDSGRVDNQVITGWDTDFKIFERFKNIGTDEMLAGHYHKINVSVMYKGVRLVCGTKSSTYDDYNPEMLGGTLHVCTENGVTVTHYYYSKN